MMFGYEDENDFFNDRGFIFSSWFFCLELSASSFVL